MSIECKEFYELMQTYRHCPIVPPGGAADAYQEVIKFANAYAERRVQEALTTRDVDLDDEEEDDRPSPPNPIFLRPYKPSEALAAIVGTDPLPRTEVTKKVWEYIKEHGLQDPTNRRMINADAKLKEVFGNKSQVSMFEMTKLITEHLEDV